MSDGNGDYGDCDGNGDYGDGDNNGDYVDDEGSCDEEEEVGVHEGGLVEAGDRWPHSDGEGGEL